MQSLFLWRPRAAVHGADEPESRTSGFGASVEQLMWAASLFWALAANRLFFGAALKDRLLTEPATWTFALALLVMLTALHYLLLSLVCTRYSVKPVLAVLLVGTALATHFMQSYGVYLDPSMMRNVLRTDVAEARELFSWTLLPHLLLYAVLPLMLLWRVRVRPRRWTRAVGLRLATMGAALAVLVGTLMLVFQPFASMMRNHKEMRYLATPANYMWSIGAVAAAQAKGAAKPREPIGLDAAPGPDFRARSKPLVVVLVVGETARAANWGLNGYARQTTPELAALSARNGQPGAGTLLNFTDVTACGTNTEVSLPCMFAPVGRRDYDESSVRGRESLLHVAARAGVAVHWRDNQSGCKGVCEGLPQDEVSSLKLPGLCQDGRCLDEGLLAGLDERLAALARPAGPAHRAPEAPAPTQLLVLHTLGNHGPSYFRRYPPAFARFQPTCNFDDLQKCSREEIVNAYDNALLYTDHVLVSLVAKLQAASASVDSAVLYVSDHGESLGESNLFLHGLPYAIAPDLQKRVPMTLWFSPGTTAALRLDTACLGRRTAQPFAHDHLFHTLLGLLDVKTALYEPPFDLAQGCRSSEAMH
ncbi:MAG: phosphoethanolamine--lipid A transferase [Betaproteobacteria bacterium]|nr:phosphoethanolamine--lipid A transferase [Betaproteobacteria bacterium]